MKPFLYAQPHDLDIDLLLRLYDPVELAIGFDWMGLDRPSELSEVTLDWYPDGTARPNDSLGEGAANPIRLMPSYDGRRDLESGLSNAVARLVLSGIQERLPQWSYSPEPGKVIYARKMTPRRGGAVAPIPRYLFTIDWASSAPGLNWPEAYHATPLPGFDCLVVTLSADTPEGFGYADMALGTAPLVRPLAESVKSVICSWWGNDGNLEAGPWERLQDTGEIDEKTVRAWADEVWSWEDEDEEDDWDEDR